MLAPLRAQLLGNWLPPVQFPKNVPGCGGGSTGSGERFNPLHGSLIPIGPHRGKVLVWDESGARMCSLANGLNGDRDQRWAIVDPDGGTAPIFGAWTIPSAFAPPLYGGPFTYPGTTITVTNGHQGLFCAGHCWLPDGRLFIAGGDDWFGEFRFPWAGFTGSPLVCIWDPMVGPNGTWSTVAQLPNPVPFLERPRWYPAVVATYDPTSSLRRIKMVVLGGIEQYVEVPPPNTIGNGIFLATDRSYLTHEAYDVTELPTGWTITKDTRPGGTLPSNYSPNTPINGLFVGPQTLSSVQPDFLLGFSLFYYARAHYLSDSVFGGTTFANGLTWAAGAPTDAVWVDTITDPNTWALPHPIITPSWPLLDEATGVLLPASLPTSSTSGEDRIARFGGQYGVLTGPTTDQVHVLDAKLGAPTWSSTAIPPLNHARKFPNATLLPDRSVLITGGENAGVAITKPEVFRGAATGWQDCAVEASPRAYHSIALLLPSGRVVTMGGNSRTWDLQVFEPHYFQAGTTRPVLISPSPTAATATVIPYNATFPITYSLAAGRTLQSASLTTPGSLTHGHDPNQRLVELGITSSSSTAATLSTPPNPTKAPYGHYLLWIVDSAGEVAVAAWVQLL